MLGVQHGRGIRVGQTSARAGRGVENYNLLPVWLMTW